MNVQVIVAVFWTVTGGCNNCTQQAETMADGNTDRRWSDIIKDWTMVNQFGEVQVISSDMILYAKSKF